jgi:WXG100 family type VII secretion target
VTEFTVPPGDPATLRSAASALGGYATEHARQLASFRAAVKTALAGWHGSAAEQYALAAGEVCGRFEGVSETLQAGQAALNRYAGALEDAQQEAGRLNLAFAALPPPAGPGSRPGPARLRPGPGAGAPRAGRLLLRCAVGAAAAGPGQEDRRAAQRSSRPARTAVRAVRLVAVRPRRAQASRRPARPSPALTGPRPARRGPGTGGGGPSCLGWWPAACPGPWRSPRRHGERRHQVGTGRPRGPPVTRHPARLAP